MIAKAKDQIGVGEIALKDSRGVIAITCYGVEYHFILVLFADGAISVSSAGYCGCKYAKDVQHIDEVRYEDMLDLGGSDLILYKGTMFTCHDASLDGQLRILITDIRNTDNTVVSYRYKWTPFR